jgi:hypothetical protein
MYLFSAISFAYCIEDPDFHPLLSTLFTYQSWLTPPTILLLPSALSPITYSTGHITHDGSLSDPLFLYFSPPL